MTEYRRKGCKVNFKNSQDEISIELIFTKKDKDVDIRDFFRKIMEIPGIEIHFKKGHYELIARGQESVLEKVPKVMENFQDFYDDSFGERTLDNTNTNFNEQQREAQKTSGNYSGHSYDASALTQSQLREEKTTEKKSYVGSLGSANSDHTLKDDKVRSLQNSGNDNTASVHGSNIKTTGTTQGIERHNNQPREAWENNEFPNDKPERDEELDEKKKDVYDRTKMTGSRYGERYDKPNDKPERDEELDEKKKDLHDRTKMTGSRDGERYDKPNDKPERDEELDEKKKDLHDRTKMTGSGDGEQAEGKRTSHNDDDDVADDDSYAHKSNNENTGIAQGSGGRYESKRLNTNSNTTASVMHENDESDGNGDTVATKVKPRDANKGRGENSNAEEQSKRKNNDTLV